MPHSKPSTARPRDVTGPATITVAGPSSCCRRGAVQEVGGGVGKAGTSGSATSPTVRPASRSSADWDVQVTASMALTLGSGGMTAPSTPTPRAGDDLTRRGPGPAADDARLERLVSATSRYCLDTWLERSLPAGDPQGADEGDVRPLSSVALALAVALRCGALAPGVSPERAVQGALRAVRACTRGHVSVGGAWGHSWLAPLSSGQLGLTALLLGDHLPNADRAAVERIVREEAVLLTELPVRYLRNTAGQLITPGDTGAEEESWRARGLSAALALLPRDAHALRWLRWLVLRQVAAYASPADVASSTRLHRAPLCAWLGGSNAEPDGSLQNHGFLPAPNYMRPVHHLVAVTQQRLAGQPVSPSALNGVEDL